MDVISYPYGQIKIKEEWKRILHTFLNFISSTSLIYQCPSYKVSIWYLSCSLGLSFKHPQKYPLKNTIFFDYKKGETSALGYLSKLSCASS